jgi:cytochrome c556
MRNALGAMLVAVFTLALALPSEAHEGATGVVKERMDAMEMMAKAMKAIDRRIKQKRELEFVRADAKSIQEAAAKMPSLFPAGTGKYPSESKAQVWKNWLDFEAKARALETETRRLAETDPRDIKTLREQALRVSDACGNCHEQYRAKHRH